MENLAPRLASCHHVTEVHALTNGGWLVIQRHPDTGAVAHSHVLPLANGLVRLGDMHGHVDLDPAITGGYASIEFALSLAFEG